MTAACTRVASSDGAKMPPLSLTVTDVEAEFAHVSLPFPPKLTDGDVWSMFTDSGTVNVLPAVSVTRNVIVCAPS